MKMLGRNGGNTTAYFSGVKVDPGDGLPYNNKGWMEAAGGTIQDQVPFVSQIVRVINSLHVDYIPPTSPTPGTNNNTQQNTNGNGQGTSIGTNDNSQEGGTSIQKKDDSNGATIQK
jgi:hypothetical protein